MGSSAKENYREWSSTAPELRLFSYAWWLDAVCPNNWDAAVVEKNREIVAAVPYTFAKRAGQRVIKMPELTPWLDIFIRYPEGQKYTKQLAYEKEMFTALIEQLPRVPRFRQRYGYAFTNWLPFYWNGFKQTTRYSYVLADLANLDLVFAECRENIRREIRKAQKRLTVTERDDLEMFYQFNLKTFERQNKKPSFSYELLQRVDAACQEHQCRKIFFASEGDRIHAVIYVVWDDHSAYYLMGGADPALRSSGASSLLMWHAIQFAATVTEQFDFEGSMIEPIERFFRSFGAVQTPYFSISKNRGLFKLLEPFGG